MKPLLSILLCAGLIQVAKHPVPDATEQQKAEKDIRDAFKEEFSRRDREARRALAQKLLAQAEDSGNTPATRYAALVLARDASGEALDFPTGFRAIDAMERMYDVRPSAITGATFTVKLNLFKASYLLSARKHAATLEDISAIAAAFMTLAEASLSMEEYDDSASFAEQAQRASKDPSVVAKAKQFLQEIPPLKSEREAAIKARETLTQKPDDPLANLALGRYLLFVRKDEIAGLECLLKGPPSPLRDAAKKELERPSTPEAMQEVGEAWLALAEKERSGANRARYEARALAWLERAFQGAGGLTRARVKKRLTGLGWIEEPTPDQLLGRWFFDEGSGVTARDSSKKGNDGTLMNGVRWVQGSSGTALGFDGKGSYVSCLASGLHFADNPQTVAWAHQVPSPPRGTQFIIALTSEKTSLILGLGYRDGKVAVWTTTMVLVETLPPPPGDWHYFAYTYDGKVHKLYVDGVLKATSTVGTMAGQYRMLEFGRWYGGYPVAGGSPDQFFQGSLDDARIYRRPLSEAEVRDLVRTRKR